MKRTSVLVADTEGSPSGSKRRRKLSTSEDDEGIGSASKGRPVESPSLSNIYNSSCRNNKPAELFRKDLISAMKLPDNEQLDVGDFWHVSDTWKQEWERGVQVPVNSKNAPHPQLREISQKVKRSVFKLPKKYLRLSQDNFFSNEFHVLSNAVADSEKMCRYDMDDLDCKWLQVFNEEREEVGLLPMEEKTMELLLEDFETQCFNKFQEALQTVEGVGIEYDEDVICDVCKTPECEEGNEMVFCDSCNICVHQACYGITAIPEGSWICRTCALNIQPSCILCPNKGGAMKSTKSGDIWTHVSCALWIPEVSIGNAERMEPITKISQIPSSRWALICALCRERVGACIQCCVKQCKVAYHVTCAFENGLEMKAIFDESNEDDGVKMKSYCVKHSKKIEEAGTSETEGLVWKMKNKTKKEGKPNKISDLDKHNARLQKIRMMEAEFHKYVNTSDTKAYPHVDAQIVDFVFNYWKIKRKANFNKALLTTKSDESNLLGRHQEDSLYARMKMFVHLRQDLERVRNLCYMVSRREKLFRSFFKTKEEIFLKQEEILGSSSSNLSVNDVESVMQARIGNSVYDKIYCADEIEPEPTDEDIEKEKEPSDDKSKLSVSARLPNPYAKCYLKGIHTRSRRHTTSSRTTIEDSDSLDNDFLEGSIKKYKSEENISLIENSSERYISKSPVVIKVEPHFLDDSKNNLLLDTATPIVQQDMETIENKNDVSFNSEKVGAVVSEESASTSPADVAEQDPGLNVENSECNDKDMHNDNTKSPYGTLKENEILSSQEALNVKNSPSLSDKENLIAHPKNKTKKVKNQVDAKIKEIDKGISDVAKEVEKNMLNECRGNIMSSIIDEVLDDEICYSPDTESNNRGTRYQMRSRNHSSSLSQDDLPQLESDVLRNDSVSDHLSDVSSGLHKTSTKVGVCESVLHDEGKDENFLEDTNEKFSLIKTERSAHRHRARRRFFYKRRPTKVKIVGAQTLELNNVQNTSSDELCVKEETTELKMSLRNCSQENVSPKPKGKKVNTNEKQFSARLELDTNSESSIKDRESDTSNDAIKTIVDMSSTPPRIRKSSPYSEGGDSLLTFPSRRDHSSSPRLVLRLKKDPERQSWQKESVSSDVSTEFRVVRNDWDDSDEHNDQSSDEIEIGEIETQTEDIAPRYLTRNRSASQKFSKHTLGTS